MPTAQIDPQLEAALRTGHQRSFDLIVRVQQADQETAQALAALGLDIRRRFSLIPSFAVTGPGSAALNLLQVSWVLRIEADSPVHTM